MNFALLVVPLAAGMFLGYFLREKRKVNLGKVTLGIILVLIFSLGFGIGSNSELLNSLPDVGLSAAVIASLAIVFSVIFVKAVKRKAGLE
ncbi:MAG TPA: LysO family transporter [candidate division Zixibacteria bacterium]|nr:LysO family transporter [candidate division Zixibacteria bacterium]